MSSKKQEARKQVMAAIKEHGLKAIKDCVCGDFVKMVSGTRTRKELGLGAIIAVGYDRIDPDGIEAAVECVVEAMPKNAERKRLEADLKYWRKNRQEIMKDHHVTPAE